MEARSGVNKMKASKTKFNKKKWKNLQVRDGGGVSIRDRKTLTKFYK